MLDSNSPVWMDSSFLLNSTNPAKSSQVLHTSLDGLLPGGIHLSSTPTVCNRSGKQQISMEKLEHNQQVIIDYLKRLAVQQDSIEKKLDILIGNGHANETNLSSLSKLPWDSP